MAGAAMPNHDNVHATNRCIGQRIHENGTAILSNANMRKYRLCHACPTLFEAGVKEHIVQNLALSLHPVLPLHFPVQIKNFGREETSRLFAVLAPHIIITGTLCSTMLTCEGTGSARLFTLGLELHECSCWRVGR